MNLGNDSAGFPPLIAVAILTEDAERLAVLENLVAETHVARVVLKHVGFPLGATDEIVRQIEDQHAEVVIVDLRENPLCGIHAVEIMHATTCDLAVFAMGETPIPLSTAAIRAGASEYIDRQVRDAELLESFISFWEERTRARGQGKVRLFTMPPGGSVPPALPAIPLGAEARACNT